MERDMAIEGAKELNQIDGIEVEFHPWFPGFLGTQSATKWYLREGVYFLFESLKLPKKIRAGCKKIWIRVRLALEKTEGVGEGQSEEAESPDEEPPLGPKKGSEWKWTISHSYFLNMGGLRLRDKKRRELWIRGNCCGSCSAPPKGWPITSFQLAIAATSNYETAIQEKTDSDEPATQGHDLPKKMIPELPVLPLDAIEDRSKTDWFTKGLAVIEILRLGVTLIIRRYEHLGVSQLEILALAFAFCAALTYAFCWNKPQNPNTASSVYVDDNRLEPWQVALLRNARPDSMVRNLIRPLESDWEPRCWLDRIPNDQWKLSSESLYDLAVVLTYTTVCQPLMMYVSSSAKV
jgi:hypothetical protein